MTRPNILLIVLDTARADHFPPHPRGEELAPRLAREVRGGTARERVWAAAPWTLPSHGSLFTGSYPSEHGLIGPAGIDPAGRLLSLRHQVEAQGDNWLPTALHAAGYHTWAVSANPWITEPLGFSRGFDQFEVVGAARPAARARGSPVLRGFAGRLSGWVQGLDQSFDKGGPEAVHRVRRLMNSPRTPFFGFVNLMETHSPFSSPPVLRGLPIADRLRAYQAIRKRGLYRYTIAYNVGQDVISEAELRMLSRLYAGEVALADRLVGGILDSIPRDQTVVIVTSDHGEALGDHHAVDHQLTMIEPVLRVPFIVLGPVQPPRSFLSLRDLPEFVASIAAFDPARWLRRRRAPDGVTVAEYESLWSHDRRLRPIIESLSLPPEAATLVRSAMAVAIEGNWKLMAVDGGGEWLYALDGWSEREIDGELQPQIRARLRSHLERSRCPWPAEPGASLIGQEASEIEERLSQLGYF
jgi:arylsulfatase A-like enzyme